jgi:hypothetical protein
VSQVLSRRSFHPVHDCGRVRLDVGGCSAAGVRRNAESRCTSGWASLLGGRGLRDQPLHDYRDLACAKLPMVNEPQNGSALLEAHDVVRARRRQ